MNFRLGDFVTRISHKHDIIFKIVGMEGDRAFLKGVDLRLFADSEVSDLVKVTSNGSSDKDIIDANIRDVNLDRSQYFYLPGKILHIDSDIKLSNDLAKPYKIRKNAKIQNYKNHQKKHKMTKI